MRIDFPTAIEMIQNYKDNQWQAINNNCQALVDANGNQKQDSRSVWFSLPELQSYLSDIQKAHGNGVRIYFGAYDNTIIEDAIPLLQQSNSQLSQVIGQYDGMQTLVMIPTMLDHNFNNSDFSLANGNQNFDDSEATILSCENHGSMAPPPVPPAPSKTNASDISFYQDQCGAYFLDL